MTAGRRLALAGAVLAAPVAWAAQLVIGYSIEEGGCSVPAAWLDANPAALRHRLIRLVARAEFGVSLTRAQTLEVARLATDWHGQKAVHLPGIRVERTAGRILFTAAPPTPRGD